MFYCFLFNFCIMIFCFTTIVNEVYKFMYRCILILNCKPLCLLLESDPSSDDGPPHSPSPLPLPNTQVLRLVPPHHLLSVECRGDEVGAQRGAINEFYTFIYELYNSINIPTEQPETHINIIIKQSDANAREGLTKA